jgi:hypothetical protein
MLLNLNTIYIWSTRYTTAMPILTGTSQPHLEERIEALLSLEESAFGGPVKRT